MYTTTSAYDSAVYATTREFKGRIDFEIIDVDAYADSGTITVTGENSLSQKAQVNDLTRNLSGKFATFEGGWILDGSVVLPPESSELANYQTGWWSNAQSQADSTFAVTQTFTKPFVDNAQDMIGVTVIFNQESGTYAEEFTIKAYSDFGVTLIDSDVVTGNTLSKYIWEQNLSSVRQIEVDITKWSDPYHWAVVTEVDYGIIKEYTDDEIINLNALIEVDPLSNVVSSDEVSFVLDNQDQEFNILNPTGIYPFLQKRQKIKPYYGLVIASGTEWIPLGDFYLTEWDSDQGGLTASFRARDLFDIMAQTRYRKGKVQNRTAENLLIDVFGDFGLTSSQYNIDSALSSITFGGNIPVVSYRQAVQIICNAAQSVVYIDRDNIIQVKQLTATASVDTVDFDNVSSVPKIKLDKRINTAEISVSEYDAKAAGETVFDGTVYVDGTQDIWIEYKEFPVDDTTASSVITGADSVNSETYYGNAALINVTKAVAGNITIVTTATVKERARSIFVKADASKGASEDTISIKLDNPLVSTTEIAEDIADWVLAEKQERFINEINWRMNPAHEIGDIVTVEDDFGINNDSRILRMNFRYNGALSGQVITKGG